MEVKRLVQTSQAIYRTWLVATIPEFSYKHLLHGGYMASANLSIHRKYLHALISYILSLSLTSSNSKSWSCKHHINHEVVGTISLLYTLKFVLLQPCALVFFHSATTFLTHYLTIVYSLFHVFLIFFHIVSSLLQNKTPCIIVLQLNAQQYVHFMLKPSPLLITLTIFIVYCIFIKIVFPYSFNCIGSTILYILRQLIGSFMIL